MLATFLNDVRDGHLIAPRRMADRLCVPMTRLSALAHVNRNILTTQANSPKVQAKLGEIARIIARAAEMTGDEDRAIMWFRHQPIIGFSGRTAEDLVVEGKAAAVSWHLDSLDADVYA